ncbi:NADH-quinone oxidoreductase subunit NuoG [Pseudodesulfovibrio sp.]|uniref:NADH-quinone oxidoreductase subunit NuoG n=1 Tax=unclassified Pseudodesulfovibrio TaxID=2661612 RepID=UPI003AFF6881
MPVLTIDGQRVEVPAGTKVIDAAEQLGIMIPRFCYLKSLGAVGACRMCAVKFLDGHKKDLDMSCMVDVRDGMVVETDHPDAVAFRAQIIEWLMLSHPHDCPICDEGGHCLLQDMTVSGGHGLRNYRGPKRTYENQYLGPLIAHEMNRCIHCYRCVRFYQEYAGGRDYGTFGIAGRVTYQRFEQGRLESPFSGNLAEICPTGTLTDKPARYRARRWDLERKPSVCAHCSLGCNTLPAVRYREVLRVENRFSEDINGDFLCDRGRYGFGYASMPDRPRQAMVDGSPVAPDTGAEAAADRIRQLMDKHGPQSVAVHVSARCTLEEMLAAQRLAKGFGLNPPTYFLTEAERRGSLDAAAALANDVACSLKQVREADLVLVLGADPLQEAPMAALAIRQAARNGALVGVVDPRPVDVLCETVLVPLSRRLLPAAVDALLDRAFPAAVFDGAAASFRAELREAAAKGRDGLSAVEGPLGRIAEALRKAKRPVLVCSPEAMLPGWVSLVAGFARLLGLAGGEDVTPGLFCLLPRANSLGAALLDRGEGRSLDQALAAEGEDAVKGLICLGADPLTQLPVSSQAGPLDGLELLVCLDCTPSATWNRADVALPKNTIFETGGCLVNNGGTLQRTAPVFAGGVPVIQAGNGSHPPREPGAGLPGGEVPNTGKWTQLLLSGLPEQGEPQSALLTLMATATPELGVSVLPEAPGPLFPSLDALLQAQEQATDAGGGELLITGSVFGADRLANFGELGQQLLPEPEIRIHTDLAEELELEEGQTVLVPLTYGTARGTLRCSREMGGRTVVLGRTPRSGWQRAGGLAMPLDVRRLWREQADQKAADAADFDPDISCQGGRL